MKRHVFAAGVAALVCAPGIAGAQSLSVPDALARLFTTKPLKAEWFTKALLNSASLDALAFVVSDITGALGAFSKATPNGPRYTVTFARGSVQATATLDKAGVQLDSVLFDEMQSAAALERLNGLFHTYPVPTEWFTPEFLSQLPIDRINAITNDMKTQLGALQSITPAADGSYTVKCANGSASATIFLNGAGKILGLNFE